MGRPFSRSHPVAVLFCSVQNVFSVQKCGIHDGSGMQSHRAAILELANLIFAKKPGKSEPAGLELNIDPLFSLIW